MSLDLERVDRFLMAADCQAPMGKVAALGALARLGVPREASDVVGAYTVRTIGSLVPVLSRHDLGRMARAVAPLDHVGLRRRLRYLAARSPSGLRHEVVLALGSVHDPAVIPDLVSVPAHTPNGVARAYQVATYPATALADHVDLLADAAARSGRFDCRLWLEVALAKTGRVHGLVALLDGLEQADAPPPEIRALCGARWNVVERFRRVKGLPYDVAASLRVHQEGNEASPATTIARLLTGTMAAATPGIEVRRDEAHEAVGRITALREARSPLTARDVAGLAFMVPALEALPLEEGDRAVKATLPLLASTVPEVRSIATRAAEAVAGTAYVTGHARHPGDPFEPLFAAVERNVAGGAARTCALTTAGAPHDLSADLALEGAARFGGTEERAALVFDVIGGGAESFAPPVGGKGLAAPPPAGPIRVVVPVATRTVHPRLEPEGELAAPWPQTFAFVVGVRELPQPELERADALPLPASGIVELVVHLETTGATVVDPERRRLKLVVTDSDRFPSEKVTLSPDPGARIVAVDATYYLDRQPLGVARWEAVAGAPPPTDPPPSFTEAEDDVDLTLTVVTRGGNRIWWIGPTESQPLGLEVVGDPVRDGDAVLDALQDVFATEIRESVRRNRLLGMWRLLRDSVPGEVWAAVEEVTERAAAQQRKPTMILATDDPQVPWEAATVGKSAVPRDLVAPLEPPVPSHLGGEAVVGRLARAAGGLRPPAVRSVETVWILAPDYAGSVLTGALTNVGEGADVAARFAGREVTHLPHTLDGVVDALVSLTEGRGGEPPDLLHVASHGTSSVGGAAGGVGLPLLANQAIHGYLTPVKNLVAVDVNHLDLGHRTFVFLNLCHGAASTPVLGQAVGLADAFAGSGARAVVAPLWQVDDDRARAFAEALYAEAAHVSVAEAVSNLRSSAPAEDGWASWLAYRCFGHPHTHILAEDP